MTTHALMTQTLPTIIGMGVVSKTAETMFGKGGKRRATARRRPTVARRAPKVKVKTRIVPKRRATVYRPTGSPKLPRGNWVQVSRGELVRSIGRDKTVAVMGANGRPIKVGMYDKAGYINGKYYLSIS